MVQKKIPSINSAHGSETRNIINLIIDVLNSLGYTYDESLKMARNILNEAQNKSNNILDEAARVNTMNQSVQQQLNELISSLPEDSVSVPELIQARFDIEGKEYPVIKERLDAHEKITQKNRERAYTKPLNKTKPLVTFYLDDGYQADYDVVLPKSSELGIPLTISVYNNSQLAGTPERLEELVNVHGWELHGHSDDGLSMTSKTLEEMREAMKSNNDFYKDLGFELDGICYPIGHRNADLLKAAREFYSVGMSSRPGINYSPIDTYDVMRRITDTGLENNKAAIDQIKEDDTGWLVLYTHAGQFDADPYKKENFFELMDYAVDQGIEVVTVKDALKVYANTIDIGDKQFPGDVVKIGADGKSEMTDIPFTTSDDNTDINAKPGTAFKSGFITLNRGTNSNRLDIPFSSGMGTLYTDRSFEVRNITGSLATQRFEGFDGTVVERQFGYSGQWSSWLTVGNLNTAKNKSYTATSAITEFPKGKITALSFLSFENADLPGQSIGTLVTHRLGETDTTSFQVYYPYENNDIYRRRWTDNGWNEWSRFTAPVKRSVTQDFGDVTTNKRMTFTVPGAPSHGNPTVSFSYGLAAGLIPIAHMQGNDTVVLTIHNVTGSTISIGERTLRIAVH